MRQISKRKKIETLQSISTMAEKDAVISKHILRQMWISGGSTEVYPMTIWLERGELVIQLATRKNVFTGTVKRLVKESNGLIKGGWFTRNDGSCPSTLTLVANYSTLIK